MHYMSYMVCATRNDSKQDTHFMAVFRDNISKMALDSQNTQICMITIISLVTARLFSPFNTAYFLPKYLYQPTAYIRPAPLISIFHC